MESDEIDEVGEESGESAEIGDVDMESADVGAELDEIGELNPELKDPVNILKLDTSYFTNRKLKSNLPHLHPKYKIAYLFFNHTFYDSNPSFRNPSHFLALCHFLELRHFLSMYYYYRCIESE